MKPVRLLLFSLLFYTCSFGQKKSFKNTTLTCTNWLSAPAQGSFVTIGDLDITGNQLTIEANFNRTYALNSGLYPGHLVSKHIDASNDNYSLFPNGCALTTDVSGFRSTFETCPFNLNQTYHVAMVYDGVTLKYYRNGYLMSQVACAGNLITNNLPATIAQIADPAHPTINQFLGDVNEVRIWNVARTQAQLRAYMNTSLPSPTTQTGLKGYYTFDDLLNKQGNTAFNGTLNGGATINHTNPNCSFTADSCNVIAVPCNNWLSTASLGSYATVGDLDITGTQLTVEAMVNRNQPLNNVLYYGHLVSKHTDASNVNYSLLINGCELTTATGYHSTFQNCNALLSKTYHVAMVYDGVSLKFYRNGFLVSQVPCSGNVVTNDLLTTIDQYAGGPLVNNQMLGYTNEVRIWNVARTQAQLQTYMNSSLPNPTTQTGLKGYYTFDDLLNKQGNPLYNATLYGGASINQTNPNCSFVADSCPVVSIVPVSNIINSYTPVLALNPCNNKITVEDASTFNVGDTVLMIQMKGAVIDSTNTAAFGNITNLKNAGNYEFNYVKSKSGNIIELKNTLTRLYDIPTGKVQLIRVPYYDNVNVTATLTALPWDGSKGGVLVLNVRDTVTLNADIDVSGKGFIGGNGVHANPPVFNCYENQFYYPSSAVDLAAGKGEGIALVSNAKLNGKGKCANGGGGGNSHNSGGGGGSNAAAGGFGGYQYEFSPCNGTVPFDNRGIAGVSLAYNNVANRVFMGGGGGAGQANNPELFFPNGGNGGGICIIMATAVKGNSNNIIANGNDGLACAGFGATGCHEGMGGGGGAGAILMKVNSFISAATAKAKGGKGANMVQSGNFRVGPGGGGSGGVCWLFNAATPANLTIDISSGANGVCTGYANDPWGSTSGQNGLSVFNLAIPVDNTPFKPNIDSVRIKDSLTGCRTYDLKGLAYTNTNAIASWQWNFGDAGTANTQNTSHTYAGPGTYNVKLVVTDVNGCKDSIIYPIVVVQCLNPISNIINTYTPVLAFNPCDNSLTVSDASTFNIGDTVLLIQMKGAVIDSTNTAAFGTITNYKNAGNYEFNYVKSKTGNIIELKDTLSRQYDIPVGKVQLIRVPYFYSTTVTSTLTCLPWDGSKGGVLVFNVRDTLEILADINTTGKGFLKGITHNTNFNGYTCGITDFYYPDNTLHAAGKGEGISFLSTNRNSGKGPAANGGGGGMDTNSGGGGGSNGNKGGRGGDELNACPNHATSQNWGFPGNSLTYNNIANKVFMGGGGGAGHCNNQYDGPGQNADYNGGNGGGLIIISSNYIKNTNNQKIISKGDSAYELNLPNSYVTHDGMGGGGAGGTVLLNNNTYINTLFVDVSGGRGANMVSMPSGGLIGPGGGGGGGVVWVKQNSLPALLSITNTGGLNGVIVQNGNSPYGTAPGLPGINVFSLAIPTDTVPFKKNIDSVRINDSITSCKTFDFKGLAYTNRYPIVSWQWFFGDAGTANTQNTSHSYAANGTYNVKLVVTDVNGCKDSIIKPIIVVNCLNPISNIINTYTPVLALNPCNNKITVEDASTFNTGDTVLIIQMKGALIDSTNTAAFGNILNYKNAGNYEFNYVKSKSGNVIELKNVLTRQYDIPDGKVQLIRVPYYNSVSVTATLTALPWDGSKGGVLAFNVRDTIDMAADIDVTGKGFTGGNGTHAVPGAFNCNQNQFFYALNTDFAAGKGDGITTLLPAKTAGKGKYANGGGGGNSHNAGGGGGSNAAAGGLGGYQFEGGGCSLAPFDNRGIGGTGLTYSNASNRVFMGGGGGAGHANNPELFFPNGGNGGGICIITAGAIKGNSRNIIASGDNGLACSGFGATGCHEGMGGGGGAGAILLSINNYISPTNTKAKGGKGADMVQAGNLRVAPGGGGSGGICWLNNAAVPANISIDVTSGANGVCTAYGNDPWGAAAGTNGSSILNLVIPVDIVLFKPNIDSVRIKDSLTGCRTFDFKGLAYTNTNAIASWQWFFGDAGTANTQNTSHTYAAGGTYTVKLVVTDVNGCKDSLIKSVTTISANLDFSFTLDACNPLTVQFNAAGSSTGNPHWSMGAINVNGLNPLVTFPAYGTYTVKYVVSNGVCTDSVSKNISLAVIPADIVITPDTTICNGTSKLLRAVPSTNFCWTPATYLDNPSLLNPTTTPTQPVTYYHTAEIIGTNLIANANFSAGNSGFTSDYSYTVSNSTANAAYGVVSNPTAWNAGANSCPDHTTGSGNMLVANGATTAGLKVWKQTVAITANTNYKFSAWVQSISAAFPASIGFWINNVKMTPVLNANLTPCQWVQQSFVWNSGNKTSVDLALENFTYDANGNDFALDDISFAVVNINRDSVKITIDTPRVKTINDTTICSTGSIQLITTGASTYSWSPVTGLSNPNIASPVATVNSSIQYIVTGTSAFGCIAKDTVNLAVQTLNSIQTNVSICAGQTYTLPWGTVVNTPGTYNDTLHYITGCDSLRRIFILTVQNFTSTTTNASICAGQSYTLPWGTVVNTAGTYKDTLHYTTGCDSLRRTVTLTLLNVTAATSNASICAGSNYTLPWGTVVNTAGTYNDTLHYIAGCDSVRRSVNLTVQNFNNSNTNVTICAGSTYTLPWGTVVNTSGTYADTLHYVTGCDSVRRSVNLTVKTALVSTTQAAICVGQQYTLPWGSTVNISGAYHDTVRTAIGCDSLIRNVNLTVNPLPFLSVSKSNDINCSNGSAILFVTGASSYTWTPSTGLNNPNIQSPVASPGTTTQYVVVGTDNNGCTATASVTVAVNFTGTGIYYMPNSFTPNGDGLNDCFRVKYFGRIQEIQFTIYNRWGEKVFYTSNADGCWDGTYKGLKAEQGNYVYYITAKTTCGPVTKKGNLLLIR